jgi:hypothetical protein
MIIAKKRWGNDKNGPDEQNADNGDDYDVS